MTALSPGHTFPLSQDSKNVQNATIHMTELQWRLLHQASQEQKKEGKAARTAKASLLYISAERLSLNQRKPGKRKPSREPG